MRFFDTHTHVNFAGFKDDQNEVIQRALKENTWMLNVGTQVDTSRAAVDLAQKYPEGVYAAIGLHPVHTYQQMLDEEESHFKSRAESFDEKEYEKLLGDKTIAVGECGLDYFRLPPNEDPEKIKQLQKIEFTKQVAFAKKHKLPITIHCRDLPANGLSRRRWRAGAYEDLLEILQAEHSGLPAVIHSFTDTWETAKKFLDQGYYIALNGILTFDKTGKLAEVVEKAPIDKLLIETDAPYLTPPPFRGKRNEPSYVKYVAQKIAEIKKMTQEEVGQKTFENACRLYNIQT